MDGIFILYLISQQQLGRTENKYKKCRKGTLSIFQVCLKIDVTTPLHPYKKNKKLVLSVERSLFA